MRAAIFSCLGFSLVLLWFIAVSSGAPATAAGKPAAPAVDPQRQARDLVVIGVAERDRLRELDLPVIWKSAAFVLAEWNETQSAAARQASIRFETLAADFDDERPLYILELRDGFQAPERWHGRALHRSGREWIFAMDDAEAAQWASKGYDPVRISRVERGWDAGYETLDFNCSYNAAIDGLVDQMSQGQWLDWIEKLSGEETVNVGGTDYTILTRYSSYMFNGNETAKAYDFALQQLESWNYPSGDIEEDPYAGSGSTWKNLVLTIPGQTTPGEVVLMTGHLDSVTFGGPTPAPGANDNGTGVATMLEAARLFRQLRFERTIKIVWFTGEEQGLYGSEAYVADHPLEGYLGVVNLDMFGYDGDGDRCFEIHAGTMQDSIDVGNCFADSVDKYGLGLSYDFLTSDATDRSDHASFWQVDVGAIEIAENFFSHSDPDGCSGQDDNPNYHQPEDTIAQNLMPSFGIDVGRAAVATLAAMAKPIGACFVDAPALSATPGESEVDLTWSPVPNAASYRLYRSTQGCYGQWVEVADTGGTSWNDAQAVEPLTYHYYVEAVDADGVCVSSASDCATAVPTIYRAASVSAQIQDVCASGGQSSGNGVIEPGESVVLPVNLRNDGNTDINSIEGLLSIPTVGVQVTDPAGSWPDLPQGQSAESYPDHFGFHVEPSVACGKVLNALIDVSYAEGANPTGLEFTVGATQQSVLLSEDFSGGIPLSWTVVDGGTGGGAAATWTTDNPGGRNLGTPFDAPFAIVDSDEAGSTPTQDEELITPTIDASGCTEVFVEFSNSYRTYSQEFCDVDVSTDGGGSWRNVLRMNDDSDGYPTPNTKSVEITAEILDDPANVSVRFHYYDAQYEFWWAIDDVQVVCLSPSCEVCAGPTGPLGEPASLILGKDGGDLVFDWTGPQGACQPTDYALYRGDLALLRSGDYTHDTPLTCTESATSFAIASSDSQIGDAAYFLVVSGNATQEGSYGRDSAEGERPTSLSACRPTQNTAPCF